MPGGVQAKEDGEHVHNLLGRLAAVVEDSERYHGAHQRAYACVREQLGRADELREELRVGSISVQEFREWYLPPATLFGCVC
jgi:hypothetical protein